MTETLHCPNCSAPLDVQGDGSATLRCPYCKSSVVIPEEIRFGKQGLQSVSSSYYSLNVDSQMRLDENQRAIRELAHLGKDIEAIRMLRSTYVVGLKQAKEMVDAIQRGDDVDFNRLELLTAQAVNSTHLDPPTVQILVDLINSGDKMNAIKLFRERTGVSLKEAKDAIDGMEAGLSNKEGEAIVEPKQVSPDIINFQAETAKVHSSKGVRNYLSTGFVIFIVLITVVPLLVALSSRGGPLAGIWARINPFTAGKVTLEFGKEGTGPGYFTDARFVSVDNNGHIFVGEFNGGRVQVFDENGNFLTQWIAGCEETGDIYLTGMSAGRNGQVYAVVGSLLCVYDGLSGKLLGRLDHPDGWGFDDVTVASDGSILAAWYKNRDDLIRFNRDGMVDLLVKNAITNITNDSELDMRVAVDGTGKIYILAYFNEAVFVFSHDGRYVTRFGSRGDEEGQFTSPRSIAIDNLGKIYISDFLGVMIYASDGRYLDTLRVNGAVMGMAFDDENNLYLVADEKVLRFNLK